MKLGSNIKEISERNKSNENMDVLSVNNKVGFILQNEQFDGRSIASENTTNYKVVYKGNFAYNPSRVNVGSIARLTNYETGIISPMYICFRVVLEIIDARYLEIFFKSESFQKEMSTKLEGSVRQTLSFDDLKNIEIKNLSIELQHRFINIFDYFNSIRLLLEKQNFNLSKTKQYLLAKLFI